jgi:hypothetical protein
LCVGINIVIKKKNKFFQLGVNMNTMQIVCFAYAILITFNVNAGLIDFETTAQGGMPNDNNIIKLTDAFMADGVSVSFGFDSDGDNVVDSHGVFEHIGGGKEGGDSGFLSSFGTRYDITAPGFEPLLGSFFLRQRNAYAPFGTFHIIYNAENPVTAASGEIWDIDGGNSASKTEQFLVKAFNHNNLLESILSPLGLNSKGDSTLDGKPWAFGFSGLSDITRIEISFTGTKTNGIGLAFNNFSPVEDISKPVNVPEPSSLAIFALSIIGLVSCRLKKQS